MKKIIRKNLDLTDFALRERSELRKKYFDLFYSKINITGDLTNQDVDYLKRKLYYEGTICATKRIDGKLLLCPYSASSWNNENFPVDIEYINTRGIQGLFPKSMRGVNQVDCVIGYIRPSHESIASYVKHQVDKIVDLSVTIKINEIAQRLPFMIAVSPEDKFKMQNIMDSIISGTPAIFASVEDLDRIQAFQGATFNLDKLRAEKEALENELKTQLGIDNNNNIKKERMIVDEVNANNDEIETSSVVYLKPLDAFSKEVSETLGININISWDAPLDGSTDDEKYIDDEGEEENE